MLGHTDTQICLGHYTADRLMLLGSPPDMVHGAPSHRDPHIRMTEHTLCPAACFQLARFIIL